MLSTRIFVYHSAIGLIAVPTSQFACLRGRNKNAKTANINAITEQIIAVNSNASVNASRIIEIFVTNRDAMQWATPAFRLLSLIQASACSRFDFLKTVMNALRFRLTLSLALEHRLTDCE